MNVSMMQDYVEYVGDYLLHLLGYAPLYLKRNPVSASACTREATYELTSTPPVPFHGEYFHHRAGELLRASSVRLRWGTSFT